MSESVLSKVKDKVKSGKVLEIAVILLLAVIVAAVIFSALGSGGQEETYSSEEYAQYLSARLSSVLSQIEGAGEVGVFLTVASDGEKVIATESTVEADGTVTTSPVLSGGDVIVLEEKYPQVTGVLIVAEGANDLNVRFALLEATASVLDINQSIIKVYTKGGSA